MFSLETGKERGHRRGGLAVGVRQPAVQRREPGFRPVAYQQEKKGQLHGAGRQERRRFAHRGSSLGCQYTIPTPEAGTADYTKVNVQYTSGSGTTTNIGNVADKAHCPTFGDAWYYDNNSAPTQIELCPTACTTVTNDTSGKIEILLGCQTMQAGAQ